MSSPVMIVGGGVAGCAAAITLAQRGKQVVLLERELTPQHKVCGEFLSEEALQYLSHLGTDPAALGAVPIHAVRLVSTKAARETALPFAAMSLTRKALDGALLQRARAVGAEVCYGVSVQSLTAEAEGWCAQTGDGRRFTAATTMLASGKHDLRGHPRSAGKQGGLIAFKMYWRLSEAQNTALDRHVELVLYRGGYAGLQPVEEGAANLCCLIDAREYKRLGSRWPELLASMCAQSPHLAARLRGAEPLLDRPLAISSIPYGLVRTHTDSLWCLGDQAAVIPSFTGDGLSLALHSGALAAEMYMTGNSPLQYQRRLAREVSEQVRFATLISKAMIAVPRSMMLAAQVWPGSLAAIAQRTRIASRNLLPSALALRT